MNIEQFYTRSAANKPIKIKLHAADGSDTEHWLEILGSDSDVFREAQHNSKMEMLALSERGVLSYKDSIRLQRDAIASLVSGWSFKDDNGVGTPCTRKSVVSFLTEAPQIADEINTLAADRSLFTKGRSKSSAKQPAKDSPYTKNQKDLTKRNTKLSSKSGKQQV